MIVVRAMVAMRRAIFIGWFQWIALRQFLYS
jgi:hypothetical protein